MFFFSSVIKNILASIFSHPIFNYMIIYRFIRGREKKKKERKEEKTLFPFLEFLPMDGRRADIRL